MRARVIGAGVAVVLITLGCTGLPQVGIPDDLSACGAYVDSGTMPIWTPEQVIEGNLQAFNDENLDCYMGSFHPDSGVITTSMLQTAGLFDTYDLRAQLGEPPTAQITGSSAQVSFVQQTYNANDKPFDANQSTGVHTLAKDADGRWRLLSTVITETVPWSP